MSTAHHFSLISCCLAVKAVQNLVQLEPNFPIQIVMQPISVLCSQLMLISIKLLLGIAGQFGLRIYDIFFLSFLPSLNYSDIALQKKVHWQLFSPQFQKPVYNTNLWVVGCGPFHLDLTKKSVLKLQCKISVISPKHSIKTVF